jgi:hypothetical protein
MLTRSIGFVVSLHLGIGELLEAQAPPLRHSVLAGCYELTVGEWQPPLMPGDPDHILPALVRLDTAAASHGGKMLTPNIAYRPSRFEFPGFPRWDIQGDTLTMIWSNGFSPTVVRAGKGDGKLEGYAEAQRDVLPPPNFGWPRASVVARPGKCRD